MFGWKKLGNTFDLDRAYHASGDRSKSPTHWWNHWFFLLTGAWDKAVVLKPNMNGEPIVYRVAYDPDWGSAKMREAVILTPYVAFRLGREPCHFMAFTKEGVQLDLEVVHRFIPVAEIEPGTTTLV